MYYSDLVKKASQISLIAHLNDVDKGGYPYIYHPAYLAFQMNDEITTCIAFLHDVIEDHGDKYSFKYLEEQGFYKEIIDTLKLLTHDKNVDYMTYIKKLSSNPYAVEVKLADLKHNIQSARINGQKTKKYDFYLQAIDYLQNVKINSIKEPFQK